MVICQTVLLNYIYMFLYIPFSYLAVDENFESIKYHHTFRHIGKERKNMLGKEGLSGLLEKVSITIS